MMNRILKDMRATAYFLARPTLLFYLFPWLMTLLVLGTVAQRYIGLFQSQKLFFGSFILWAGPLPLPGAYTTIGVIALGLCAKLLLKSPLRKHNAGIIIAHLSTLILLLGGLLTAVTREEGYMVLGAEDTSHKISDYHERELVMLKDGKALLHIPAADLHNGKEISSSELPFKLRIIRYCYNCRIEKRATPDNSMRGDAARLELQPAPYDSEDAKNQTGAMVEVSGTAAMDGNYITSEGLAQQPEFVLGNDKYGIVMQQEERDLPFDIHLLKFTKTEYPGTEIASSYRAEVQVIDGALKWNTVIEMNQPLRYRGYTLYQSSFVDTEDKLLTVLAVVKNSGAIFPYIAITAICIGLLLHLAITFARRRKS
ncbi:MAG TPA: cytochrome c biogenesis protein ResB [Rickettsiales bacterium]|nr:cytochrome c biogenesis protein ResB [Rickettsiales bacterium]